MASDRVQRLIDGLLDKAEEAIGAEDWDAARKAAEAVLRVDPANHDAIAYLGAAARPSQRPPVPDVQAVPILPALAPKSRSEIGRAEGERRTVTVLFADARNFTGQSERMDEEAVYEAMRARLKVMADSVSEVEGRSPGSVATESWRSSVPR